jgi:hypothetical protein
MSLSNDQVVALVVQFHVTRSRLDIQCPMTPGK